MSSILYIVNPAGHGGAGIKVWERVQSAWSDQIDSEDVRFTERQGHAREIAASAAGYDILTAVGGDGTVREILSGIMALRMRCAAIIRGGSTSACAWPRARMSMMEN